MSLGSNIAYLRKQKKLTQEQFAELIEKSWSFIAQAESTSMVRGVSLKTLFRMAEVLQVEPAKLLQFDQ